jgi:hypothetical protein
MTPDQLTAAITDLARSVADIYSLLSDMTAQRQWPMPPFLPCGMLGYGTTLLPGTTLLSFQDVQPTLQQIEQTMDITTEPAGKMLTCKVSAAVRLQAVARGLLARRQLQEMRQPMHEATLATIDLSSAKRDLAPWDSHQQPRRPAAVFRREHSVFPAGSDLQLYGSGGRGVVPLLVTGGDALSSATGRREDVSAGRYRD